MKKSAIFLLLMSILLIFTGCEYHLTFPIFTEDQVPRLFTENKSILELVAQDIIKNSDSLKSPGMEISLISPDSQEERKLFSEIEWKRLNDCCDQGWCRIILQQQSRLKMVGFAASLKDKNLIIYYYINDSSLKQYIKSSYTDIDDHWIVIHSYQGKIGIAP